MAVWKRVFKVARSSLNATFGTILESLKQHKDLLMQRASLDQILRVANERRFAATQMRAQEQQARVSKRQHLATWLSASDVDPCQEKGVEARESNPQSCRWILRKDTFREWHDVNTVEPLLWIHGSPGSGMLGTYSLTQR